MAVWSHQERAHSNKTQWLLLSSTLLPSASVYPWIPWGRRHLCAGTQRRVWCRSIGPWPHPLSSSAEWCDHHAHPDQLSPLFLLELLVVKTEQIDQWSSLFLLEHAGSEGRTNFTTERWAVILHNSHKNEEKSLNSITECRAVILYNSHEKEKEKKKDWIPQQTADLNQKKEKKINRKQSCNFA